MKDLRLFGFGCHLKSRTVGAPAVYCSRDISIRRRIANNERLGIGRWAMASRLARRKRQTRRLRLDVPLARSFG